MFNLKASFVSFFVITLVSQFQTNAGLDWVEFFERWIFGSANKPGQVIHSHVLLEGENAEKKFIDNEVHKVSRPKIIKAQIEHNTESVNKWYEYHKSANFIMRYIAEYAMDSLWERREKLYEELEEAREDVDLEPFCHYRYHNNNESEADSICRRAFQNRFFQDKGWALDDDGYMHCSRVTVSKILTSEHGQNNQHHQQPNQQNRQNQQNQYIHRPKLAYYREARRCSAYIKKGPESSPLYFSVYLISHEVYLKRKQFAYFVLLNRDTAEKKGQMKRILRYLKFWEEKKVQVAAYIES